MKKLGISVVFFLLVAGCGSSGNPGSSTGGGAGTSTAGAAGRGGTTGTGGATGAAGATGQGGTVDQGVAGTVGSGGTTGTAGSGGSAGTAGTGGNVVGTGGNSVGVGGLGGSSGGRGGTAGGTAGSGGASSGGTGGSGTGGSSARYTCPSGTTTADLSHLGTPTRINGAPPTDSFNNSGNNFTILEGPVWIADALYVSEFGSMTKPPASRIIKIDASDAVSVAFPAITDTGSNGLAVDPAGNLVSANHGVGGIVRFTLPSGTPMTTLTSMYMGARFDSPNDLAIRSDGTVYFTDFSGDQTPSPAPQSAPRVYMLPPGSSTATALFTDNSNANGIALSLDEKTLYVGDGSGLKAYTVNTDGSIGATGTALDATDFANQNSDGMTLDCAGDLYVVRVNQHDVVAISPSGQKLANITVPGGGQITNVAFGGSDHKTLYITAMGTGTTRGVFKLAMPVAGLPY
jgi:gluconolactonase